ncbi:hypothetical protein KY308_01550 [Candidatus Woesearchaeota archaeon]|nr:hypothetical protein [Candidatus Woesearchaeota archaeon]
MNRLFIIVMLTAILTISGCSSHEERFQDQIDKAISEKFDYSVFSYDGFTINYPLWPAAESDVELSVTRGYCSVAINVEKIASEQWYGMIINAVEQKNGTVIISNEKERHIKFSVPYQNLTMVSDNRLYDCNGNGIVVTIMCIKEADEKTQEMHEKIFNSAKCEGKEIEQTSAPIEKTTYKTYNENDFSVTYPDWDKLQDNSEHKVGVSKGICSVVVDKHNALPKDIYEWYKDSISKNKDYDLLESSSEGDTYHITYEMPYEDKTLTSKSKVIYCNYQSYITQVICVNDLITEEFENIRDKVLESSKCSKVYEVPTPEKTEQAKQEVENEDPEAIEEISNEIVKTNAGEEFGIDEEAVVYFINNNEFFTKIMKDFPKANIVIEDSENNRELDLRVKIGIDGRIELLEDGKFSDADVTLKVPLRDALNIFGNAQNINPLTLIGFAANVRTEPSEIKDEVIQKVLRGEYR